MSGMAGGKQSVALGTEDDDAITIWIVADKAINAGILPDRQSRTGGAPRLENFGVSSRANGYPFKQLQREAFVGSVIPLVCLMWHSLHAINR
jgi:hypothetical protein